MNRERILFMDNYILLSFINTKLRDEFSSLKLLCNEYDIKVEELKDKLHKIEYVYNENTNQFVSKETM